MISLTQFFNGMKRKAKIAKVACDGPYDSATVISPSFISQATNFSNPLEKNSPNLSSVKTMASISSDASFSFQSEKNAVSFKESKRQAGYLLLSPDQKLPLIYYLFTKHGCQAQPIERLSGVYAFTIVSREKTDGLPELQALIFSPLQDGESNHGSHELLKKYLAGEYQGLKIMVGGEILFNDNHLVWDKKTKQLVFSEVLPEKLGAWNTKSGCYSVGGRFDENKEGYREQLQSIWLPLDKNEPSSSKLFEAFILPCGSFCSTAPITRTNSDEPDHPCAELALVC